jgi:hypothetical protein
MAAAEVRPHPKAELVLRKALLRAAQTLGLSQKDLAAVIGVSAATVSRLASEQHTIDPSSKSGELALLLLRVYRSLDALVGGDGAKVKAWFHAENAHLGGVPATRVCSVEGLCDVARYLDAMRGHL